MRHRALFTHQGSRPVQNYRCKHHIRNRSDGGKGTPDNLLLMWRDKERLFHELFGNMTLFQAANLLFRVARAKKRQKHKAA